MRLVANPNYWDAERGPHLEEVVFRNDLARDKVLDLVCTTEGEVDIVTEVPPAEADRVQDSEHARLVAIDPVYSIAGVINREGGLPLADRRARRALNLAVDRDRLVREAMFGRASALGGLSPDVAVAEEHRIAPYDHYPAQAAELWRAAFEEAGTSERPLKIAAAEEVEAVARRAAEDIRAALGVEVEVRVYTMEEELPLRRRLAEKLLPQEWDLLIYGHGAQEAEAAPLELHRAFAGETGEFRAGPVIPEFESLLTELVGQTDPGAQAEVAHRIDRYVHEEALALFLCAPQALYAVNRHVDFTPYRTTFELPECRVSPEHWSRR